MIAGSGKQADLVDAVPGGIGSADMLHYARTVGGPEMFVDSYIFRPFQPEGFRLLWYTALIRSSSGMVR